MQLQVPNHPNTRAPPRQPKLTDPDHILMRRTLSCPAPFADVLW